MSTKTITLTLCDLPHDDDADAFPITITTPEGTWDVDVCVEHAGDLLALVAVGRRQGRARRPRVQSDA